MSHNKQFATCSVSSYGWPEMKFIKVWQPESTYLFQQINQNARRERKSFQRLTMLCLELAVMGLRKDLTFWFFSSKWSKYLLQASQGFWIQDAPLPAMATDFCILNDKSDASFNKKKSNYVCSVQQAKKIIK